MVFLEAWCLCEGLPRVLSSNSKRGLELLRTSLGRLIDSHRMLKVSPRSLSVNQTLPQEGLPARGASGTQWCTELRSEALADVHLLENLVWVDRLFFETFCN